MQTTMNGVNWTVSSEAATELTDLFQGGLVESMERSLTWSVATKAVWGAAWYLRNGRNLRPGLETMAAAVKASPYSPEPLDVAKIIGDAARKQMEEGDSGDSVIAKAKEELTAGEFRIFMEERENTRDNDIARYREVVAENGGEVTAPIVDFEALVRATYQEWQTATITTDSELGAAVLDLKSVEKVVDSLNKLRTRSFSLQDRDKRRAAFGGGKANLDEAYDFSRSRIAETITNLGKIWCDLDTERTELGQTGNEAAGILGLDGVTMS